VTRSAVVTSHYFNVLGVSAQFGRTFMEGEDQPGRSQVVVLSHDLWERRFGSDPAILGRTIRLNREDYTVIGVMPADFHLMGFIAQLWTPLVLTQSDQTAAAHDDRSLRFFGRLKPGVTLEQARAEMSVLARRAAEAFPETEKSWGASARTLPDFLIYDFSIRNGLAVAALRQTLRVRLNLALTRTPDDKLGPYEIVAPLGKGGMGARHTPPRAGRRDGFGLTIQTKATARS
jgi:putative ABC transport system permease protein